MQKALLFKLLVILALTIVICAPLSMIHHTIAERSAYRAEAVASVAADSVREQTLVGPVLVVRYVDEFEEIVEASEEGGKSKQVSRAIPRQHLVFPNDFVLNGSIETDRRTRGNHQVLVYSGSHTMSGDFVFPGMADLPRANRGSRLKLMGAAVAIGIEDVRGIRNIPKIMWDGKEVEFQQGSGLRAIASGLHAELGAVDLDHPAHVKFSMELGLDGIERQHIVPIGKNNKVTIKSNWLHPQFGGRFLPSPRDRVSGADGFRVSWNISALSSNAQQQLISMERETEVKDGNTARIDRFNVAFIEPVNVYSMADRAVKYGLLFVALTFAAFFLFEILKRLPIHPVQYLLVGLALALFFLLLVSLSERIAFLHAYLAASVGCIVLIGFYLSHVLRNWRRGVGFGVALTALYGALYGLLISENNALLMGSILLFAVLSAIMVATRKVDWYQVGKTDPQPT